MNCLTASRNLPFHSAQTPEWGKLPTWYRPPASQASAISFLPRSTPSWLSSSTSGGSASGVPRTTWSSWGSVLPPWPPHMAAVSQLLLARVRMEARSKRKPSMRYSMAQ